MNTAREHDGFLDRILDTYGVSRGPWFSSSAVPTRPLNQNSLTNCHKRCQAPENLSTQGKQKQPWSQSSSVSACLTTVTRAPKVIISHVSLDINAKNIITTPRYRKEMHRGYCRSSPFSQTPPVSARVPSRARRSPDGTRPLPCLTGLSMGDCLRRLSSPFSRKNKSHKRANVTRREAGRPRAGRQVMFALELCWASSRRQTCGVRETPEGGVKRRSVVDFTDRNRRHSEHGDVECLSLYKTSALYRYTAALSPSSGRCRVEITVYRRIVKTTATTKTTTLFRNGRDMSGSGGTRGSVALVTYSSQSRELYKTQQGRHRLHSNMAHSGNAGSSRQLDDLTHYGTSCDGS